MSFSARYNMGGSPYTLLCTPKAGSEQQTYIYLCHYSLMAPCKINSHDRRLQLVGPCNAAAASGSSLTALHEGLRTRGPYRIKDLFITWRCILRL